MISPQKIMRYFMRDKIKKNWLPFGETRDQERKVDTISCNFLRERKFEILRHKEDLSGGAAWRANMSRGCGLGGRTGDQRYDPTSRRRGGGDNAAHDGDHERGVRRRGARCKYTRRRQLRKKGDKRIVACKRRDVREEQSIT